MTIHLKLLQLLVQRRLGLTKREIAEVLQKSTRQVERYLAQLKEAGLPVVADGAPEDGVALRWRIDRTDFLGLPSEVPPLDFSLSELFLLLAALESNDLPQCDWLEETRQALLVKLAAYQPLRGLRQIPLLRERIIARSPGQGREDTVAGRIMETVLEALTHSRCLELSYPWHRQVCAKRVIEPLSLVLAQGTYYCLARIRPHADLRLLKLSRIKQAKLLAEDFDPPPPARLRAALNKSIGLWQEEPRQVQIRFDAQTAPTIETRKIHASQRLKWHEDGTLDLYLTVGGREEMLWWLLQWGAHAELIQPADWREEIAAVINEMQKKYYTKENK